ncbi:MAG TPA: HAD family hydrolase, partial [Vicinamibacterales bacterium]
LISNSHRCLVSFQSHFELNGLITAAVSSSQHGYLKPHPSIFQAALQLVGVEPGQAVMVGDSVGQDVAGALRAGMRAVLVRRGAPEHDGRVEAEVPVIHSLEELLPLL